MLRAVALVLLLVAFARGVAAQEEDAGAAAAPPPPEAGPPAGDRDGWLARRIATLAERAPARLGVAVIDVVSGRTLFARNAADGFVLASTVKLVTSAAALALLGPEYRFKTTLLCDKYDGN